MIQPTNAPATVEIDTTSRYRNTRLLIDGNNIVFFGTWRPPKIFETQLPLAHIVAPEEVKRPDLISYRVYKDPNMFWAIAIRNNVFMPLKDIRVGQTLLCPHIDDVMAALARSSQNSVGAS